jgi:osmotically-inducible protein OsmY
MRNKKYDQRYNQENYRGDESSENSRHRNAAYDRTERDQNQNIYNRYNRDDLRYGRGSGENNPNPGRNNYPARNDSQNRFSDVPDSYRQSRYGNDENPERSSYSRDYSRDFSNNNRDEGFNSRGDGRDRYIGSERGYYEGSNNNRNDERGWWDRTSDEISSWMGDEEAARRREMDSSREGKYRGFGPKNYTRSDERIKEDINDRLTDYHHLDASHIDVAVENGDVVLTGTVENRHAKRAAEDITEDVSGVKNVENRLRVQSFDSARTTETIEPKSFTKNA